MIFDKLSSVESRYEGLMSQLGSSELQSDPSEYRKAAKALSDLEPLVQKFREYKGVETAIAGTEEMLASDDADMRAMAEDELAELQTKRESLLQELKILLIPKDPNDEKNVLLEIRAGTGGDEAALFAADLFRMYQRYAEGHGWRLEVMSSSDSPSGGLKEVIASISGRGVYSRLKYESGVHRVQRVPAASTSTLPIRQCASSICRPESSSPRPRSRSTRTGRGPCRSCAPAFTTWSARRRMTSAPKHAGSRSVPAIVRSAYAPIISRRRG
jgi:peptide chain release factor 1